MTLDSGPVPSPKEISLEEILTSGLTGEPHPVYPGAVAAVAVDGVVVESAVVGDAVHYGDDSGAALPAADRVAATTGTVFDIASLTKLFTATVVMRLVAEGLLDLDRPVAETFDSYAASDRSAVTLRHLLTHTSGLPAHAKLWTIDPAKRRDTVLAMPLEAPPGHRFTYSCLGYITAGWLAEEATGRTLPELLQTIVTTPLGLSETGYLPGPELRNRSAATEYEPYVDRGIVRGEVHDENSWSLGGTTGNAGIFSTLDDLVRFGEFLRGDGGLDGEQILPSPVAAQLRTDQLPATVDPGYRAGFGTRIGDRTFMGSLADTGAIGHTGFTGTTLVVDRSRRLTVVLLTNRVHPSRDWSELGPTRRAVADYAATLAG